jgi:hypothetical protein
MEKRGLDKNLGLFKGISHGLSTGAGSNNYVIGSATSVAIWVTRWFFWKSRPKALYLYVNVSINNLAKHLGHLAKMSNANNHPKGEHSLNLPYILVAIKSPVKIEPFRRVFSDFRKNDCMVPIPQIPLIM